jgi:hypothetical protein
MEASGRSFIWGMSSFLFGALTTKIARGFIPLSDAVLLIVAGALVFTLVWVLLRPKVL